MNKIIKYSIALLTLLSLISCATLEGPKYSELPQTIEQGKARVVAFRVWSGTGGVWPAHFYVDGKLFAELANGGLGYIEVEPGMHRVSTGPASNPTFKSVDITTQAGKVYFVRLVRGMPDTFEEVDDDETVKMLMSSDFRYQPLKAASKN